ncbi:MAG: sulfite exporter TauE/SafE family protein [Marinagarivorans sp.]|nr:sulfite exporter TauE/SafE family protein [Marinagarivorans sp.]
MVELFITALLLGLMGAGHCLGMCGGFAAALAYALPPQNTTKKIFLLLSYNLGRISSYAIMGGLVAASQNALFDSGYPFARTVAGLLLIATALYLANIWTGIVWLERGGRKIWRYLQPISQKLLPVYTPPKAFALGMVWGWLPCGLVYSILALAATQASALEGSLTMAAFGMGTLPAVFAGGLAAAWVREWLSKRWFSLSLALCFGLFGVWTIAAAWHHHGHHHGHHMDMNDSSIDHMNHSNMDHSNMDHSNMDHSNMDHRSAMPAESASSVGASTVNERASHEHHEYID